METKTPDPDLARAILLGAGADPLRIIVEEHGFGWHVATPGFGSGCTTSADDTLDTPQELAAHLVGKSEAPIAVEADGPEGEANAAAAPEGQHFDALRIDDIASIDGDAVEVSEELPVEEIDQELQREPTHDDTPLAQSMPEEGGNVQGLHDAYPGVAWEKLSDELSILRAQVIDMISAREEIRLDALVDPSRREDLRQSFIDYQNKGALGLEPSAQDRDLYVQYMDWQAKESTLRTHASALRRSARDADIAILRLMAANVDSNWP